MKRKNAYMVAVQLTVRPTVYIEIVAENEAAALKQIRNEAHAFVARNEQFFVDEVKTDMMDYAEKDLRIISAGRASQYYDVSECEICSPLKKLTIIANNS